MIGFYGSPNGSGEWECDTCGWSEDEDRHRDIRDHCYSHDLNGKLKGTNE